MNALPSYEQVTDALITLRALGTAAETQGLLCALLSAGVSIEASAWVDSLLATHLEPADEVAMAAYNLLMQLFEVTKAYFARAEFELTLLLPEDELPLDVRAEALSEWCQGYLTGLHLLGIDIAHNKHQEIDECLKDLIQMSRLSLSAEDLQDQESEVYLEELIEHVHVAVLTIRAALGALFDQSDVNGSVH